VLAFVASEIVHLLKVPTTVKVVVSGVRIIRQEVRVFPFYVAKDIFQHGVESVCVFGRTLRVANRSEVFIEYHVVLRRDEFSNRIVYQDDIASMFGGVTHIYSKIAAILPLATRLVSFGLEVGVEYIDWTTEYAKVAWVERCIFIGEERLWRVLLTTSRKGVVLSDGF